jgi:hypothetical protein
VATAMYDDGLRLRASQHHAPRARQETGRTRPASNVHAEPWRADAAANSVP